MENIPDDLALPMDGRHHLPLSVGFHSLLDQAKHSVEVVSSVWNLNSWDMEPKPSTAKQVQVMPHTLQSIKQLSVMQGFLMPTFNEVGPCKIQKLPF